MTYPGQTAPRASLIGNAAHRARASRYATGAVLVLAILFACASAALATQPVAVDEDPFAIPPNPRTLSHIYDASRHAPSLEMSERIRARLGGDWRIVTWNSSSGCPRRVWGSGIDVVPGIFSAQEAEQAAREFIRANPDFFGGALPQDLARYRVTHALGKWAVLLQQTVNGIPVHGAIVTLTFTESGRLFAFGANYYGRISAPPAALVSREQAVAIARADVPYDAGSEMTRAPDQTVILPVFDAAGEGSISFRLAHVTEVATAEPYGLYQTWVDAENGRIIRRENQVSQAYTGRATGDVETTGYCAGNTPETPFAKMNVVIQTLGTAVTDSNGDFSIPGNADPLSYTASFNGPVVDVNCTGCGGDAAATGTIEPGVFEPIVFDSAGYRADERDCFYVINKMYDYVRSIDSTWTLPKVTANVNVNSSCGANWGGTVLNFFRARDGCQNTGQIADVIAHEYGHGIHWSLMGNSHGPNGQGEGNSDIAATFFDDGSVIGVGIVNCIDGLSCPGSFCRDCENALQWPDDAVGQDIHLAGRVICGFNWDARQGLEAKYGAEEGKLTAARLWHYSRKLYGNPSYDQDDQAFDYFVVNDDNGNLLDTTPDYAELRAAAEAHGFPYPAIISIVHTPLTNTTEVTNPYPVVATITSPGSMLDPDSLLMRYRIDSAGEFVAVTMTPTGNPDEYAASIPAQPCGSFVEYYISADDTAGFREVSPASAPSITHLFHVAATLYAQNFETASDWTTDATQTASTGAFVRINPIATNYQPGDDTSPSPGVFAWITAQNQLGLDGIDDVDEGIAASCSPIIDMAGWDDVRLTFKYFHGQRDAGDDPGVDFFRIQISNDGGATYPVDLVTIGDVEAFPTWTPVSVTVASLITPTSLMRVRIQAADGFPQDGDIIEGGIDDISVTACAPPPPPPDTLPPIVDLLSPNGGEALVIDSTASITWTASDDRGVTGIDIFLSRDGGAAYDTTIAAGEANDGEYTWSLANLESTSMARIKIVAADSASNFGADTSEANFTIAPPPPPDTLPPVVDLLTPNGGEALVVDSVASIMWTATDDDGVTGIDILLSRDGGGAYDTTIATGEANDGEYTWNLANLESTNLARIKVVAADSASNFGADTSAANFTIGPPASTPPTVLAVAPNGGEMLQGNSPFTITWTSSDDIGVTGVDIRLSTNGGADFGTIIAGALIDTGSYDWLVPNLTTTEAAIQIIVIDANYQVAADTSDTTFSITEVPTGVEVAGGAPERAFLAASVPEPFTQLTTLRYGLARPGPVVLAIYSVEGRLIRSLVTGAQAAGAYEATWDGLDGNGRPVTSGRYFIRLTTPEARMTRGATFLR